MKRTTPFTADDCIRTMYQPNPDGNTNEGLVAILSMDNLKEQYKKPEYQLYRLTGGFGCRPTGSGRTCYGRFCVDGIEDNFDKYSFVGIANAEVTKYAEELESVWDGGGSQAGRSRDKEDGAEAEM